MKLAEKQRYTAEGAPATKADAPVPERQPFIDAVAASNPMMTTTFLALGGEERVTVNARGPASGVLDRTRRAWVAPRSPSSRTGV